jgi:hypothetical protein
VLPFWRRHTFVATPARRFLRRERGPSSRLSESDARGNVDSYEDFVSLCRQDYLDYKTLFAVNDEADPAVPCDGL